MVGKPLHFVLLGLVWLAVTLSATAEEKFPLRAEFPKVKYITTDKLFRYYRKVIIIDVRSKFEFDVVHINKAMHIPVSHATFGKELEKVRSKNSIEPLVFYCNGHRCKKSFEAAAQAGALGFRNVFAYDAGIHDWTMAHPEKTMLMGKTPAPKEKMIPEAALKQKMVGFAEFRNMAVNGDAVVIDIREPYQRQEVVDIPEIRNIPSDRLVQLLAAGEFGNKLLLITDAVGKQVEWLQYYLENYGYKNYRFLENGVLGAKAAGAVKTAR